MWAAILRSILDFDFKPSGERKCWNEDSIMSFICMSIFLGFGVIMPLVLMGPALVAAIVDLWPFGWECEGYGCPNPEDRR